jgi:hypothetical protein
MKQTEDKQVDGLVDWYRICGLIEMKEYGQLPELVQGINDTQVLQYIIGVLCERLEGQNAE